MKKTIAIWSVIFSSLYILVATLSCSGNGSSDPAGVPGSGGSNVSIVKLTSDEAGVNGARVDPNLVNAWGTGVIRNGDIWISSNGKGLAVVYDTIGRNVMSPITIPGRTPGTMGTPTGAVWNNTMSAFMLTGTPPTPTLPAKILYVTEDGLLLAWAGGPAATEVARADTAAVYKGVTIGSSGGAEYIYTTNFKEKRIDVYNTYFNPVSGFPFKDETLPADYGPFGIANIDSTLYVSYAKQAPPANHDDLAGAGNGFVDVYRTDGTFVRRFVSNGPLNSPWGMTRASAKFGAISNRILIGNFGDGLINSFDNSGNFIGSLADSAGIVHIDGLWSLFFASGPGYSDAASNRLYFTAGPGGEKHGLFGYMVAK